MATLRFGSTPTSVMCHVGDFGCGPGAWTTVMKIDGNKVIDNDGRSVIFRYPVRQVMLMRIRWAYCD